MSEHWGKTRAGNDTLLGFDYGVKKIGVAVGQLETGTASALETVRSVRGRTNWSAIECLIETWRPGSLVVGVSYREDGGDNPVTPRILRFCRQLEGRYRLPVHRVDECLSTYEAKQMLFDDMGVSASRLWEVQDRLAAQLILQTWLNQTNQRLMTG